MSDVILNAGLDLAMAFGEDWLAPIQPRLSRKYPDLDQTALDRYDFLCRQVMDRGHEIVPQCFRDAGGKQKAAYALYSGMLKKDYPWISESNLSHLFGQGCYYAWKDGGLP